MSTAIINVSKVPQRSPFRYPGGKTWFVPYAREWLRSLKPKVHELIEPFAGGAIVSLTSVMEDLVDRAVLVELDKDVAAVWQTILNGQSKWLTNQIRKFKVTRDSVESLAKHSSKGTARRQALATIVRNRVNRGGILAPGAGMVKNGENGKGLLSRWYPETLVQRVQAIQLYKKRFEFIEGDGLNYLVQNADRTDVAFFIDPPYTKAGRRLYAHSEIDHDELFRLATNVRGDILLTYDNAEEIRLLAKKWQLKVGEVRMQGTHLTVKTELVIGRDLSWLRRFDSAS